MNKRARVIIHAVASILICQAAGFTGSLFTASSIGSWYATLKKPWFTPPNELFGPVWIALYLIMGIALFLVWRKGMYHPGVRAALIFFAIQLVLNVAWSIFFFGMRSLLLGLIDIIALWCTVAVTMLIFSRTSKLAAWLLYPYLVWLSFALVLNYSIMRLN